MFEYLIDRWQSATDRLFKSLLDLADSLRLSLINLDRARKRNTQLISTADKEANMWSNSILDLHAHWLFISHNPRNNRRTKKKR